MAQWAEKILIKVEDDPLMPRVLLLAATGKAASLIGKNLKIIPWFTVNMYEYLFIF